MNLKIGEAAGVLYHRLEEGECSLNQVKTYELMDGKKVRGIIENIVYIGMLKKTEKILGVRSCKI